jgi:hypothetical protein
MALVALVFIELRPATAYSGFEHPAFFGGGGFQHFDSLVRGGRQNSLGGNLFDNYYGRYYNPLSCPTYEPMKASGWFETRGGSFVLRLDLPGVRPAWRLLRLGEDGHTLHVKAGRPLSARGRECLPGGARVSADGASEVFEQSFAIPATGDPTRAKVRDVRGGVEVIVPEAPLPRAVQRATFKSPVGLHPGHTHATRAARLNREFAASLPEERGTTTRTEIASEARSAAAQRGAVFEASDVARSSARNAPPTRPAVSKFSYPPLVLPSSEGLEVVDEEWPEVQKNPDAAEGWWDNRGEFQYY